MKMKRVTTLLLLLLLITLSGCDKATVAIDPAITALTDEEYFTSAFTPVLRFVVCSDVHIDNVGTKTEEERFARMFDVSYSYADAQLDDAGIASVFVAGDISDSGTLVSMQKFFRLGNDCLRGDTVLRACLGNHEFYNDADMTVPLFMIASGYDSDDSHIVINDYHFIMLSPDKGGKGYSEVKQKWLLEQLKSAAKDDPSGTKPIFVMQHHHVSNTVYGSVRWGVNDLKKILDQYPQVVDFSGHSHFPIDDPTSVWQGTFTALGTGTLSYSEVGLAGVYPDSVWAVGTEGEYTTTAPWESGGVKAKDIAEFYIVEVDARNAIRILGYDLISESFFMEPILLRSVGDPDKFRYTDARKDTSEPPYFTPDDAVTIEEISDSAVKFRFPQAVSSDHVQNYRCELWEGNELVSICYRLSCTFYTPAPETLTIAFDLPGSGEYTLRIYGVNCFAVESTEPLTLEFNA